MSEQTLGQKLKMLRGDATLEEIASRVGIAKTTLHGYESGRREPDLATLQKLARALNTTAAFLLGETDDPSPSRHVDTIAAWSPSGYDKLTPEQQREVDEFIAYIRHKYRKGGPYDRGRRDSD